MMVMVMALMVMLPLVECGSKGGEGVDVDDGAVVKEEKTTTITPSSNKYNNMELHEDATVDYCNATDCSGMFVSALLQLFVSKMMLNIGIDININ